MRRLDIPFVKGKDMAKVEFRGKTYTDQDEIARIMKEVQIPFERWGVRKLDNEAVEGVLSTYSSDIDRLKNERDYVTQDVIALDPNTPDLPGILAKFSKEHHHTDDEVRFVVAGEGVFEINLSESERIKFTAEPGDLIVVPAWRRHLFYLTSQQKIRCIRLFKDKSGWEAHYPYAQIGSSEHQMHFS